MTFVASPRTGVRNFLVVVRTKSVAAAAAGIALLALAVGMVAGAMALRSRSKAEPAVESGSFGAHLAVGSLLDKRVPDLQLIDDRGASTSLASFKGRYLVLAPAMTLCHEVCPMTAAALQQIQRTVDRDGLANRVTVAEA